MKTFALAIVVALAGAGTVAAGPIVGQSFGNIATAAQSVPATAGASAASLQNARVLDAFGTVERKVGGDASLSWKSISVGDLLAPQTTLRTGDNSALLLQLPRGHLLRISSQTTVLLRQVGQDNQYSFKVLGGQVWSLVRKANHPAKFEVETPSAVAGVTGTIFSVAAETSNGQTVVSTDEGSVVVHRDGEQAAVTTGNFVSVGPMAGSMREKGLVAQPQSAEMRQMWSLLRSEGVLVRRPRQFPNGRAAPFRLQREIQPQLYRGFLNYRSGRFAPAPEFTGRPKRDNQEGMSPILRVPRADRPGRFRRGELAPDASSRPGGPRGE